MMDELECMVGEETGKFRNIHILVFNKGITKAGLIFHFTLCIHVIFSDSISLSLMGNHALIAPISPKMLKLLDFLSGRNKELLKTLLFQSSYQPYWADILRWRRKEAFYETDRVAWQEDSEKTSIRDCAKGAEKRFTESFVNDVVENIITISMDMRGDSVFLLETLKVVLEIPTSKTEEDMKTFYLEQYRKV